MEYSVMIPNTLKNKTEKKGGKRSIFVLVILLIICSSLLTYAIVISEISRHEMPSYHSPYPETKPHAPISINSNLDFTYINGVTSGLGTKDEPYIIENWEINAKSKNGISIQNTSLCFVIRNCYIYGKYWMDGIYLNNVTNGTINNITCEYTRNGIWVNSSAYNQIINCAVRGGYGIDVSGSNNKITSTIVHESVSSGIFLGSGINTTIENCITYDNSGAGILICSSNNLIINCTSYRNDAGISLEYASNNTIINCTLYANSWNGITFSHSSYNTMEYCLIYNHHQVYARGIDLSFSSNNNCIRNCTICNNWIGFSVPKGYYNNVLCPADDNLIYSNNFIDNIIQAEDSCSNHWNNETSGNYWNDYTGKDANIDGVGDTSYKISEGNNRDYYPLMNPVENAPSSKGSPPSEWAYLWFFLSQFLCIIVVIIIIVVGIGVVLVRLRKKGG